MGGGGFIMEPGNVSLDKYLLSLAGKSSPKISFLGTASGDAERYVDEFYSAYKGLDCEPSHLSLFRPHTRDIESYILDQDIIHVGGGNTRNLLALWREWSLDKHFKKALSQGIILSGMSAGMICWFEEGLTDSQGIGLEPLECLGLLEGSACPHFDGEEERRPTYIKMVEEKRMSGGLALDDGVGALYIDGKVRELVSSRQGVLGSYIQLVNDKVVIEELTPRFLGES